MPENEQWSVRKWNGRFTIVYLSLLKFNASRDGMPYVRTVT
jgi:hypothetical protein